MDTIRTILVAGLALLVACSDDSTSTSDSKPGSDVVKIDSVSPDGPVAAHEAGVDGPVTSEDGAADLVSLDGPPKDGAADLVSPDGSPGDGSTPDSVPDTFLTDAPLPQVHEVLFSVSKIGQIPHLLGKVKTDGTGVQFPLTYQPTLATISGVPLANGSGMGVLRVRPDRPYSFKNAGTVHPLNGWVRLPDGGLLLVDDNKVPHLVRKNDLTALGDKAINLTGGGLSLTEDGKLAAGPVDTGRQLRLFKLDGTTWSNGTAVLDVTGVTDVNATIFVGQDLYCVHGYPTVNNSLVRVPTSGASTGNPQTITIPDVGGTGPDPDLATNGTHLVGWSRATSAAFLVYVVSAGATTANTLVSQGDANNHPVGPGTHEFLNGTTGPNLAISPGGEQVAYMNTSHKQFWVIDTATKTKVTLNNGSNFATALVFGGLFFADEDNLIFWGSGELFRYQISTATVFNLTKSGASTSAPWGPGTIKAGPGWTNAGREHLFVTGDKIGLIAVDLTTFTVTTIANDTSLYSQAQYLAKAPTSSRGYLSYLANIRMFDHDAPAASTTVRAMTTTGFYVSPVDHDWLLLTTTMGLYAAHTGGQLIELDIMSTVYELAYGWTPTGSGVVYTDAAWNAAKAIRYSPITTDGGKTIWQVPANHGYLRILDVQ